jgi:hypothetical protein
MLQPKRGVMNAENEVLKNMVDEQEVLESIWFHQVMNDEVDLNRMLEAEHLENR